MGAQGTTTVNFGAFPGATDTSVSITGQATILSGSLCEAWIFPVATADHSADEHWAEDIFVSAGNVVGGTGFTIYARIPNAPEIYMQQVLSERSIGAAGGIAADRPVIGQPATRLYGLYTVAWCWN